jgi:hypothetical protein
VPVAASEQTLRSVVPGNGEELTDGPTEVVLTFAEDVPPDATATVSAPGGDVADPALQVDGRDLRVTVRDDGPGQYEVQYTVGSAVGSTGYTVLEPGREPTVETASSFGVLVSVALIAALVAVMVMTVLRWRRR